MTDKQFDRIDDEDIDLDDTVLHVGDGVRLTDDVADEMATQLEGRDRSKANLVPGGKSLSGTPGAHSPVINVRVAPETREGLREMAGGPGVSKIARQALDDAQRYFVVWEQSFDGTSHELVRFNKAMTLEQARSSFENFKDSARSMRWRNLQIRRGADHVVDSWNP